MANITGTQFNDNGTWNAGAFRPSLHGSPNDDDIVGLAGHDKLYGYGNDDELYGGAGRDDLYGGWGNDELYGGRGDDYLNGNGGDDELYGGKGKDDLYGDWGHDELHGGKGDDYLNGGFGADDLSGGKGADKFDYNAAGESISWSTDTILDFSGAGVWWNPGEGDKIDLSDIDADVRWWKGGEQEFDASQLSYDHARGVLKADIHGTWNDVEIEICGGFNLATDMMV
jgi:Ca2+-binding RTX toxin-like protein